MKKFLLEIFIGDNEDKEIRVISEDDLFKFIQDECELDISDRKKFVVYKIGQCVLDLS